jgi:hypothetical protein
MCTTFPHKVKTLDRFKCCIVTEVIKLLSFVLGFLSLIKEIPCKYVSFLDVLIKNYSFKRNTDLK